MKTALDYLSNALGKLMRSLPIMEEDEAKQAMNFMMDSIYLKSYALLLRKYGQAVYTAKTNADFFNQGIQIIEQLFSPTQLERNSYGTGREVAFGLVNNFLLCIHAIIELNHITAEFSMTIERIIEFSRKNDGLDCIQQPLNELLSLLKSQEEKDESLITSISASLSLASDIASDKTGMYSTLENLLQAIRLEEFQTLEAVRNYIKEKHATDLYDLPNVEQHKLFLSQQNLSLTLKQDLLRHCFKRCDFKKENAYVKIMEQWIDKISKENEISKKDLFLDPCVIHYVGGRASLLNALFVDSLEFEKLKRAVSSLGGAYLLHPTVPNPFKLEEFKIRINFSIKNGFPISELMKQTFFKDKYESYSDTRKTDAYQSLCLFFDERVDVVNNQNIIRDTLNICNDLLTSISEQVILPEWYFMLPKTLDWKMRIFLATKIKNCEQVDAYLQGINKLARWFSTIHRNEHEQTQSFEDFFMKNQVQFGRIIDIMEANTFDFLEKYFAETLAPLEKMLKSIIFTPMDTRELMCVFFEHNKEHILANTAFFKIWESFLVSFSRLPDSLSRTVNTWDFEKKALFLNNYCSFIVKFTDINEYANSRDPIHFREPVKFFSTFSLAIEQLIEIMGATAFPFFQKYLAATVISLEKLLEKILPMTAELIAQMAELFTHYQSEIMDGSQHFKRWENILITASLMVELNKEIRGQEKTIRTLLLGETVSLRPENLALLEQMIINNFLKTAFYSLELTEEEISRIDINALMGKISSHDLPKLILAQQKMKDNCYYAIFIQLFKSYLLNDSIESVVHGSESEKPIEGSALDKLIQHNQALRQTLLDGHIDPNYAHYNKKLTLTYEKGNVGDNHILSVFKTLWGDLEQVKQQTEEALLALKQKEKEDASSLELTKVLESLLKRIMELKKNFDKKSKVSEHKKYASLLNDANKNLFQKVYNSLNGLKTRYSEQLTPSFSEYATHYTDRYNVFKPLAEEKLTQKIQTFESKKFTVAHWDKNKISSLFLGSPVQCCLAPDGHQFPALIQRLMDDAMFFHVVTEGDSETPVALSWLYFVRDGNNPEHIYVMANFLEISPKYGSDEDAKQVIINALLHYTDEFVKYIGAKGFLINHLTYGWIKNFDVFDQAEINPQKVGGCLTLDSFVQHSSQLYYLSSLHQNSFHCYNLDKIPMEQQVRFLTVPNEVSYSSAETIATMGTFSVAKATTVNDDSKLSTGISCGTLN
jgi:hypothetical protein